MGTIETTFASKEDAARVAAGWLFMNLFCNQMDRVEVQGSEGNWVPKFCPAPAIAPDSTNEILESNREFVDWAVEELVTSGVVANGDCIGMFHGIECRSVNATDEESPYGSGYSMGTEWAKAVHPELVKRLVDFAYGFADGAA